ncbi:MAG: bacillithiol system redox-active protein YtxJ [Balneolaceae bacterium]
MSFFSGLRGMIGGTPPELPDQWMIPDTESDVEKLLKNTDKIQIIYKHSFTCGVSVMAKPVVEEFLEEYKDKADFHFINVKQNRPVSNYIAKVTGVRHESPQILIINKGEVYWSESHGMIRKDRIREALEEI